MKVMVTADLARVLLAGALAVRPDSAPVACAVAFGLSCGQVPFSPVAQSLLPSVVDDELVAANSGIWTAAVTAQVLVAPVATLLAFHVGFGSRSLSTPSASPSARQSYGPCANPTDPAGVAQQPVRARLWGHKALAALPLPLLGALAAGQLRAALSADATSTLLVVLARDRLGGGDSFGLPVAAISVGAAPVPLLPRLRITDPRRPLFVFGPYAVRGLVDLILAVAASVPLAAGARVFYGLSTVTGNVTFSSLIQYCVPEDLHGRAFAGVDTLWQTGRLLSLLGGGLLAGAVGSRAGYLLGGLLLLVGAAAARTDARTGEYLGPAGTPAGAGCPDTVGPDDLERASGGILVGLPLREVAGWLGVAG